MSDEIFWRVIETLALVVWIPGLFIAEGAGVFILEIMVCVIALIGIVWGVK